MDSANLLKDIAKAIDEAVPDSVKRLGKDAEQQIKAMVHDVFVKMDLVTRDEFDAQTKVLARAHKQCLALEKRVAELEDEKKGEHGPH